MTDVLALASPLAKDKTALLQQLLEGMDGASLLWLSGYAAGLAGRSGLAPSAGAAPQAQPEGTLTLVYGTQTGNSRHLAEKLKQSAEAAGLTVRTFRADAYPLRELKNERVLYVVISTQGDGDPPDDSRGFFEFLLSKRAPKLPDLRFSVLALGDSSYPKFCDVGRRIDERLAELGGRRLVPRTDCDVDYKAAAGLWHNEALEKAKAELKSSAAVVPLATVTPIRKAVAEPAYNREKPFLAPVLANQRITAREAEKDVRHVELSLEGSGLIYEPGDSVGVCPRNPPELVEQVLEATKLDGAATVTREGKTLPLSQWLSDELELTRLTRPFLNAHAERAKAGDLAKLLGDHQPVDVLREYPAEWKPEDLVAALRRITPRLYSIASSQKLFRDEVHLTVSLVEYDAFGVKHFGAASRYLSTRATDDQVQVFIESNERFRLPSDPAKDIIMIGPGTGVAPFRAFLQERQESGGSGRNWLFFGEQHFRSTFLYQVEWQEALKQGSLHRLDLAFSRDQAQKIYVQHRIREQGKAVYEWLEGGASLYVCGDAKRMAPDVNAALIDVAMVHGGKSKDDAEAWLNGLRDQQRYLTDVY